MGKEGEKERSFAELCSMFQFPIWVKKMVWMMSLNQSLWVAIPYMGKEVERFQVLLVCRGSFLVSIPYMGKKE